MEQFEPFDLKIAKLSGATWNRESPVALATQLYQKQGRFRASLENRIFILFDNSLTSSVEFLRAHRDILVKALLNVAHRPYSFTCYLPIGDIWASILLLRESDYRRGGWGYYHHPIGDGMREMGKADFENILIRDVAALSGGLLRHNANKIEHGYDGDLLIDSSLINFSLASFSPIANIQVCDYGIPPVPNWRNCLPCPLYKNEHCLSRGAAIYRAIHAADEEPR